MILQRLFLFSVFIILFVLLTGCSKPFNPVIPSSNDSMSNEIPIFDFTRSENHFTTIGMIGEYELSISNPTASVELISKRGLSIGESYIVSGRNFFVMQPCTDCLGIKSIALSNEDRIILTFSIRHPFEPGSTLYPPSARNRLDLDVFDMALLTRPQNVVPELFPSTTASAYSGFLQNADGYTTELAELLDDTAAIPYVLVIDDNDDGLNTYNEFPMGAFKDFDLLLDVESPIVFDIYLTMGYGASATKPLRLYPTYFNPEFNRKNAWKVDAIPPNGDEEPVVGNTWSAGDSTTLFDVTVRVFDWQIGANVDPSLTNPTDVYAASEVAKVSLEIPGMFTGLKETTVAESGTGAPDDPLIYKFSVANEESLSGGNYHGLVKVSDTRVPNIVVVGGETDTLAHSVDGAALQWININEFATYQIFTASVVTPSCGPITGSIVSPQPCPDNLSDGVSVDFVVSASSANGGNPIILYEVDHNYDGITFNPCDSNASGLFDNVGPFNVPSPCESNIPKSFTVAFRATDSCTPSNSTIFASCVVTVNACPTGNLYWAKQAGGTDYDYGRAVSTLSDNSVFLTGDFQLAAVFGKGESNETTLNSAGRQDFFIARYNSNGTLQWVKRAGNTGVDYGYGITTLPDNSAIVTGGFQSTVIFGQGEPNQTSLTSSGDSDIFIAKYNSNGMLMWAKRAGGTGIDNGYAATILSDNSAVITGNFQNVAIFGQGEPYQTSLTSNGNRDIFVARFDPNGALMWAKAAGGFEWDDGVAITRTASDTTVVAGYFQTGAIFGKGESNETSLIADGSWDLFIAKYNTDGTLAWVKKAGGVDMDRAFGVATLSDNSTAVAGLFFGTATFGKGEPNQTTLMSAGAMDCFIARFNPDGTLMWVKHVTGLSSVGGSAICALGNDSTVMTGIFWGSVTFGQGEPNETILTSPDQYDIFFARYNPNGTLAWAKRAGGYGSARAQGITALSDNSTVTTGTFTDTFVFGPGETYETILTSVGGGDIYIGRLSP